MKNRDFAILMTCLIVAVILVVGLAKMNLLPEWFVRTFLPSAAESYDFCEEAKKRGLRCIETDAEKVKSRFNHPPSILRVSGAPPLEGMELISTALCSYHGNPAPCAVLAKEGDERAVYYAIFTATEDPELIEIVRHDQTTGKQEMFWKKEAKNPFGTRYPQEK